MTEVLTTILIGIIMGFSSGLFGIGGSVAATPFLMLFLGLAPILALATPLPAAVPSAASGSVKYYRSGMINFKLAAPALIAAVPFGWLGSHSTSFIDHEGLVIAKAVFLILLGLKFFISSWLFNEKETPIKISIIGGLASGALAGYVAGVLAVGGGIVLVTAFVRVNNMPMKKAVATSLFCVFVLAIFNSAIHFNMNHIEIKTTLILAATVIPFAYLGSKLAISLRNKILERLFGAVMIVFALFFIYTQVN